MESLGNVVEVGAYVPRALQIDIDNQSDMTFNIEGAWFGSGGWCGTAGGSDRDGEKKTVAASRPSQIPARGQATLNVQAEDSFSGVRGLVWFVTEKRDSYLSLVFSSSTFWFYSYFDAWAGPPPKNLKENLDSAASLSTAEHGELRGVRWEARDDTEWGLTAISLVILANVPPYTDSPDLSDIPKGCYLGVLGEEDCADEESKGGDVTKATTGQDDPVIFSPASPASPSGAIALRIEPGAKVLISGLKNASVASLNGKLGEALEPVPSTLSSPASPPSPGKDNIARWHVRVDGLWGADAVKSIKETNLEVVQAPLLRCSRTASDESHMVSKRERDERLMEEEMLDASRPRDVVSGVLGGIAIVCGGFLMAVGSIIVLPVYGARTAGPGGCVAGLCVGTCAATGVSIAAIITGGIQSIWGALNTPVAIVAWVRGLKWHPTRGRWLDERCNLADMERLVQESKSDSDSDDNDDATSSKRSGKVKETALYEVLCAKPTANEKEIKKAYYKEALKWHPDKNPGDDSATIRFQKIQEAYQVLSNPELRERYDRQGEAGIADKVPKINPVIFFSILFGGEKFEPYVGSLDLASMLQRLMKGMEKGEPDMNELSGFAQDFKLSRRKRRVQLRRVVTCAIALRKRLDGFVRELSEADFVAEVEAEAKELANTSFGPQLLSALGWIYVNRAEHFLATVDSSERWPLRSTKVKKTCQGYAICCRFVGSAASSLWALKSIMDVAPNPDDDEETQRHAARNVEEELMKHLPTFLNAMWNYCALDIEHTTRDVCRKLLKDVSVPWIERYRRALALRSLGRVFLSVGTKAQQAAASKPNEVVTEEACDRFRHAASASVQRK